MIEYRLHVIGKFLASNYSDIEDLFLPKLLSENKKMREKALREPLFSGLRKSLKQPFLDPIAEEVAYIVGQTYRSARFGLLRQMAKELNTIGVDKVHKIMAIYSFEPRLALWVLLQMVKQSLVVFRDLFVDRIVETHREQGSILSLSIASGMRSQAENAVSIVDRCMGLFFGEEVPFDLLGNEVDLMTASIQYGVLDEEIDMFFLGRVRRSFVNVVRGAVLNSSYFSAVQFHRGDIDAFIHCFQQMKSSYSYPNRRCEFGRMGWLSNAFISLADDSMIAIKDRDSRQSEEAYWEWGMRLSRSIWDAGVGSIEAYPDVPTTLSAGGIPSGIAPW
jgi:hypothetical protein